MSTIIGGCAPKPPKIRLDEGLGLSFSQGFSLRLKPMAFTPTGLSPRLLAQRGPGPPLMGDQTPAFLLVLIM